jgi:nucleoside-diphosphate-sugar epimerase
MLVTGGTGAVGSEVVEAARRDGWRVVSCSRRPTPGSVTWDMSVQPAPPVLRGGWDVVVHTAARLRWNLPAAEAWRANVEPVRRLAAIVTPATRVVLVSSAFVIGRGGGPGSSDPSDYQNTYEWSRAAAEREAAGLFERLVVVRPPLVIGRRVDGGIGAFFGLYTLLHALMTSMLPLLVADSQAYLDLAPVSDVAQCCLEVSSTMDSTATHVLGAGANAVLVGSALPRILATLNDWRARNGHGPVELPALVTPEQYRRFFLPMAQRRLSPRQLRVISLLEPFVPYLSRRSPIEVTWPVGGVLDCLDRSVRAWAQSHPALASRSLNPWPAAA